MSLSKFILHALQMLSFIKNTFLKYLIIFKAESMQSTYYRYCPGRWI